MKFKKYNLFEGSWWCCINAYMWEWEVTNFSMLDKNIIACRWSFQLEAAGFICVFMVNDNGCRNPRLPDLVVPCPFPTAKEDWKWQVGLGCPGQSSAACLQWALNPAPTLTGAARACKSSPWNGKPAGIVHPLTCALHWLQARRYGGARPACILQRLQPSGAGWNFRMAEH